jgi:hypothetical protein
MVMLSLKNNHSSKRMNENTKKHKEVARYHQDNTIPKGNDWIWVFGSNQAGRHGAGAAKIAHVNFKAKYGKGDVQIGHSYAIPTKDSHLKALPIESVMLSIRDFLLYAKASPEKQFFVTRVGCGLAGYPDDDIGPLFKDAPVNCSLPEQWKIY